MKSICVIGDSFCFHRDQPSDWPKRLSESLDLKLIGNGYRGQHWWFIRQEFLKLLGNIDIRHIELFVICHTDPNRIIGTTDTIQHKESEPNKSLVKSYLTHLENTDYNSWCCQQWFKECNRILDNRKVIHIQNFPITKLYFGILDGVKLQSPSLLDIGLIDVSDNSDLFNNQRNHFTLDRNLSISDRLIEIYYNYKDAWPKSLTESW